MLRCSESAGTACWRTGEVYAGIHLWEPKPTLMCFSWTFTALSPFHAKEDARKLSLSLSRIANSWCFAPRSGSVGVDGAVCQEREQQCYVCCSRFRQCRWTHSVVVTRPRPMDGRSENCAAGSLNGELARPIHKSIANRILSRR